MCDYSSGDVTNNYVIIFRKWPPLPGVGGRLVVFKLYFCVRKEKGDESNNVFRFCSYLHILRIKIYLIMSVLYDLMSEKHDKKISYFFYSSPFSSCTKVIYKIFLFLSNLPNTANSIIIIWFDSVFEECGKWLYVFFYKKS